MLKVVDGVIIDAKVKIELCPLLNHGPMPVVHAIVMHQTNSSTAKSTLAKYKMVNSNDRTGAHFLLDKDGTMYQTLQINHKCAQVAPITSRCLAELTCSPADKKLYDSIKVISKIIQPRERSTGLSLPMK